MLEVSEIELRLCYRVCKAASQQGFGLKEYNTILGRSFSWRLKDGRQVDGALSTKRQEALVQACNALLPHIFAHV